MSDISEGIVVLRNDTEAQGRYESGTTSQPGCNSAQREVGRWPNAALMLGHRWPSIKAALGQRLVLIREDTSA